MIDFKKIKAMGFFLLPSLISNKQLTLVQKNEAREATAPASTVKNSVQDLKIQGRLRFLDLAGEELSGMETTVVAENWVAIPSWLGFNSQAWIFWTQHATESRINKGIWQLGDPVGLWQCQDRYDSPELDAWKVLEPLMWHSYVSGNLLKDGRVSSPQPIGQFFRITPPRSSPSPH